MLNKLALLKQSRRQIDLYAINVTSIANERNKLKSILEI